MKWLPVVLSIQFLFGFPFSESCEKGQEFNSSPAHFGRSIRWGFQVSKFPSQHISLSQVAHPVRHCPHPSLPGHLIRIFHENKIERMKNMFKVRLCTKNKQTYQLVIAHPILKPYFEICILPYLVYNSLSMSYHNAKHTVQSYTAKSSKLMWIFQSKSENSFKAIT